MTAIVSHLTGRDLRRAMSAVQTQAAHDSDSASFVRVVLDQLPELVASDLTTLSLCGLRRGTREVLGRPGESLSDADRSAFDQHFREHPLVRFHGIHPGGPTQRISDCASARAFRDSPVFADYYRRLGINFVMALPLRIDAAFVVSVVFNRSRADFTDRERALLDTMRRPLAALYRGFVAREDAGASLARLQDLAVGQGRQVVRVSLEAGLEDGPADDGAADLDELETALRKLANFVRCAEPLVLGLLQHLGERGLGSGHRYLLSLGDIAREHI